jgi:hypothetical protein
MDPATQAGKRPNVRTSGRRNIWAMIQVRKRRSELMKGEIQAGERLNALEWEISRFDYVFQAVGRPNTLTLVMNLTF